MRLYDILADYYEEIFPFDTNRLQFITGFPLPKTGKILDIGCANGSLALALAGMNYFVIGIDLNERMISFAKQEAKKRDVPALFYCLNMLQIDTLDSGPFDHILCFGNTLPHLPAYQDIPILFSKVLTSLKKQGIFIFQILNFDAIMTRNEVTFPDKETHTYIFKRHYKFKDDGKIDFHILLLDKRTGEEWSDFTTLLPLYEHNLMNDLKQAGFTCISMYADYNKTPVNKDDFSRIYVIKK